MPKRFATLPPFTDTGDLPLGVHGISLRGVVARFGSGSRQRLVVGQRLERIHAIAAATGHLGRFIIFGSFVTSKAEPNDVDVFLIMDDRFEVDATAGETRILFDHAGAQAHFGASVFWLRRRAALGGEEETIQHWQIKRDGGRRGIVEVVEEVR